MVSRVEVDFTKNWFANIFISEFNPLGNGKDNILTPEDENKILIEIGIAIGMIFSEVTELNFYKFQIDLCQNKFKHTPEELMLKYDKEFREYFKDQKGTKGNIIFRIAPFFLLNDDTLDIYFEMTENACISNPIINFNLDIGCNLIIFQYDNNLEKADMLFESIELENKWDRFIIINGNKFADVININKDFLKSLISFVYISNDSKFLQKIKHNPDVIIKASELTKSWLFKTKRFQNF